MANFQPISLSLSLFVTYFDRTISSAVVLTVTIYGLIKDKKIMRTPANPFFSSLNDLESRALNAWACFRNVVL